jgi:hypothetical protein
MKYGALRGFEGANAANRYATSNSSQAGGSKQGKKREKTGDGAKEREREREKSLKGNWGKRNHLPRRTRENGGTGRYTQIRMLAGGEAGAARNEYGIFRGLVG